MECVETLLTSWEQADSWLVGRYVIMPDHLHLFCAPHDPKFSLRRWIRYWKSIASRKWPHPGDQPIWQPDCWDTQLRRGESYSQKWDYVWRNPVRKGLAANAEDWPYAGELNILAWHDK